MPAGYFVNAMYVITLTALSTCKRFIFLFACMMEGTDNKAAANA